jgi:biopolymer transport protein ExbB
MGLHRIGLGAGAAALVILAALAGALAAPPDTLTVAGSGAGAAADLRAGAVDPPGQAGNAPNGAAAEPARPSRSGAVGFMLRGGIFMWPLLFCAILTVGFIVERLITFQGAQTDTRKLMAGLVRTLQSQGVDAAKELCVRTRGPIAAILHAGLTKVDRGPDAVEKAIDNAGAIELAFLERGLVLLSTLGNLAPLLGFLGTASGMIHAFDAISAAGPGAARVVAGGVAEALITTVTGLAIAIPAQGMYNYFVARVDHYVIEMEQSSVELLEALTEMGAQ